MSICFSHTELIFLLLICCKLSEYATTHRGVKKLFLLLTRKRISAKNTLHQSNLLKLKDKEIIHVDKHHNIKVCARRVELKFHVFTTALHGGKWSIWYGSHFTPMKKNMAISSKYLNMCLNLRCWLCMCIGKTISIALCFFFCCYFKLPSLI
jgi:hypothetical protein